MNKSFEKSFKRLFLESMAEMVEGYFNPQFERIDKRFENLENRFKNMEGRVGHLENQMVTKSYLDKKIAELKGDTILKFRKNI